MKTFEEICAMTQDGLKSYLKKFMRSYKFAVRDEPGFLYCEPDKQTAQVMMVAHLDTVHHEAAKEIHRLPMDDGTTRLKSPQGIGGDDRCGVYIIMNLIKNGHRPVVLFCEDEESGCVGAKKFCDASKNIKLPPIDYLVEVDRRGKDDAVFYSCDNADFTKWINEESGFKTAYGSCSDISRLMPSLKIAGVNFSSGYYQEHTKDEYVVLEHMESTIDRVGKLLKKTAPQSFEYKERQTYNFNYNYKSYMEKNYGAYGRPKVDDDLVHLFVTLDDDYYGMGNEEIAATGKTKHEAWFNFFRDNEDICYSMIYDYRYR